MRLAIAITLSLVIGYITGSWIGRGSVEYEATRVGAAHYNPASGVFEWDLQEGHCVVYANEDMVCVRK